MSRILMIIALTGTPGTGKSKAGKVLAGLLRFNFIEANDLAEKAGAISGFDPRRKTLIVDTKELAAAARRLKGNWVISGHLSHFCPADYVFVLRTRPDALARRLKKKRWPAAKIDENVEAEILDVCTQEAVGGHGIKNVFEIDTTEKTPDETAAIVSKILRGKNTAELKLRRLHRPGSIDWTEFLESYEAYVRPRKKGR